MGENTVHCAMQEVVAGGKGIFYVSDCVSRICPLAAKGRSKIMSSCPKNVAVVFMV